MPLRYLQFEVYFGNRLAKMVQRCPLTRKSEDYLTIISKRRANLNIARLLLSICQSLRLIQQCKLRLSPFEQHGMAFTLVVAESDILPINIPVASLQLSDQLAFGYFPAPQQTVWTDIVGERGKQERILPELPEHRAELPQVFPQKHVRLPLRHGACRIPFAL